VKEHLRVSHGVSSPLSRVTTTEVNVAGIWVPAGVRNILLVVFHHDADILQTQLGVAVPFVNLSPALFPDPYAFKPERWMKTLPGDIGTLGSFSRGVRGCIGKQLAMVEVTMIIASVYRRFELEWVEGKYQQKDIKSLFNPYTVNGDARVKLKARKE
jgi:cytochrome P450